MILKTGTLPAREAAFQVLKIRGSQKVWATTTVVTLGLRNKWRPIMIAHPSLRLYHVDGVNTPWTMSDLWNHSFLAVHFCVRTWHVHSQLLSGLISKTDDNDLMQYFLFGLTVEVFWDYGLPKGCTTRDGGRPWIMRQVAWLRHVIMFW